MITHVATPVVTVCVPQPVIVVPPSVNKTVPVAEADATVAVYVTVCATVDGFADEDSTVVVAALPTTCVKVDEVDVR